MNCEELKEKCCFKTYSTRQSESLSYGCVVWARWRTSTWWPALVLKSSDCGQKEAKIGYFWIFWFSDYKISQALKHNLMEFTSTFSNFCGKMSNNKQKIAMHEALEVLALRSNYLYNSVSDLMSWAENGFLGVNLKCTELPAVVLKHLVFIINSNTKNNLVSSKFRSSDVVPSISLSKVRKGLLKLDDICIACHKEETISSHPLFIGGLCYTCKGLLLETIFAIGEDGKNIYCVICGKLGKLILCDNDECQCSYCTQCLSALAESDIQKILETSPWFCFFCDEKRKALLKKKKNWEENLYNLFCSKSSFEQLVPNFAFKKPIKVLSLFDGISAGKLVLDTLGIAIDTYFASEIDENAISVSKLNYSNSIIHIGDITHLTEEKIASMCPLDLVMGGSPCNDLSLVNPARKGLYNITGTGSLFFDFFHVLSIVRKRNKDHPVFYLFENVAAMSQSNKMIISSFFMQEPVLIDAKYFSPQIRPRYFWGNIPGMFSHSRVFYKEENYLSGYLLKNLGRKAMVKKINTVTTKRNSMVQKSLMPVEMNGIPDLLWITELEKVFGFPVHYTDTGNLSISKRQELLGRSWSVPVIIKILCPLTNIFLKRKDGTSDV